MKKFLATLFLPFFLLGAFAQQQVIPIDKNVKIGQLDNGLTYYIRHNEEPKGQANFYIAQKVGSILEEEEQRGLAHFLEHMCFNGTQKFPGNGVIKYCESIGVKFGADLNAYTSIDETVYNIDNVPVATTPGAIDSCLWILHDWADGLLLTDEDIDHERGVIHEEWRSRSAGSAMMRMYEKILPEIYPNNRYGQRLQIGLMEVVDCFPYKALRDYYEKWYRPDQQGIIVVGDVNVDEIEAKIKSIFGTIAKPVNPAERYYVPVEDNMEPIVSIAKDKEQQYAISYMFFKHDVVDRNEKTSFDYYALLYVKDVIAEMINQRLAEMTHTPNPPFLQAMAADDNFFFAKTKDAFTATIITKETELLGGIAAMYREVLRAVRNGFTESEYERARAEIIAHMESAYNEREKVKSADYCREYVRHFIDNEPIAGIENDYLLTQQIANMISVEMVNEVMKGMISDHNRVIACMLPDKENVVYPTADEIVQKLKEVDSEDITAYEDKVSDEPLIKKMPKAGKVVKTENAPFGYKKIILSNGATVYLKTTDFKADQINMRALSEGGTSLYKESEATNLKVIDDVFTLGGVGNFSETALNKALSGKKVNVEASIGLYNESLRGTTTPKDFETMLQLTYLYFTALRTDKEAFESWKNKYKAFLMNAQANPMTALGDTIRKEIYPASPRIQRMTLEEIDQINYARIMKMAKERFSNASDFSFVFTGNIDEATAIPLLEKYIASLPAKGKEEDFCDMGLLPKKGVRENIFNREMEIPTATTLLAWSGTADYTLKNKLAYSIASQVIDIVLTEEIREKEGGTYGVSVSAQFNNVPQPNVLFEIYYQTDPEKYTYLNEKIVEVMNDFAKNGPSADNLSKVKEYMIKKYQEGLRENSYYEGAMTEYLRNGMDKVTDYEKVLDSLAAEEVRTIFAQLLKQNNRATVIMHGIAK